MNEDERKNLSSLEIILDKDGKKIIDQLKDIVTLGVESLADSQIDSDIIKAFPILKIVALVKDGVMSIRDGFMIKKIVSFSESSVNEVSLSERLEFASKIGSGKLVELSEKTFHVIDHSESIKKSEYLGYLMKNLIIGNITSDEYHRYCFVLQQAYTQDLEELRIRDVPFGILILFHSYGLAEKEDGVDNLTGTPEFKGEYKLNESGKKFLVSINLKV